MSEAILTTPIVVATFRKNAREEVHIGIATYKGHNVVDVRSWAIGGDGNPIATRSGITLSVRHVKALADGLANALREAERRGLLANE